MKKLILLLCFLPLVCFTVLSNAKPSYDYSHIDPIITKNYLNTGAHYMSDGQTMCAVLDVTQPFENLLVLPNDLCYRNSDFYAHAEIDAYSDGKRVVYANSNENCSWIYKDITRDRILNIYKTTKTFTYCVTLFDTSGAPDGSFWIAFTLR